MNRPAAGARRIARLGAAIVAAALLAAACAKREAPSGGPPDIEPPRLVAASPDSGTAGIPLDPTFSLAFSEPMEPRSTEQAVSTAPNLGFDRLRWRGRVLTITLAESLQAGRTYTLFVGGTARDRHNNPMGVGSTIVFSTADSFPAGRIEGQIQARGFVAQGTNLWCYDARRTGVPDSTARDFDAIGFATEGGRFRIDGLEVPGRYRLWGFADLNRNRSFEPEADVLAAADTVIELTAAAPVAANLSLDMVNPRAPGRVFGNVVDARGDSAAVLRIESRPDADTTQYSVAPVDRRDRSFIVQLSPGGWTIRAFVDLDRDFILDPDEPTSAPFRITMEPAAEVRDVQLEIRRRDGE